MGAKQAPVAIADEPDPGDSVLVLSPTMGEGTDELCVELLTPNDVEDVLILWVTMNEAPHERVAHWLDHRPDRPRAASAIDVRANTGHQDEPQGISIHGVPVSTTTVSTPHNLTKLGVEIVDQLKQWDDEDGQIVLCFDSLSTFLQYVDTQKAFKFLHALGTELTRVDAISHFHMDPGAHEEQTINTLLPLFRSKVEPEDGEWIYRSR